MIHFRLKYADDGIYEASCDEHPGPIGIGWSCQAALEDLRDKLILVVKDDRGCDNPWQCETNYSCDKGHTIPSGPLFDSIDCPECEKENGSKQENSST